MNPTFSTGAAAGDAVAGGAAVLGAAGLEAEAKVSIMPGVMQISRRRIAEFGPQAEVGASGVEAR
ncbi:hypothetical protein GCM10028812_19360 [Ancylobacter sonchi]